MMAVSLRAASTSWSKVWIFSPLGRKSSDAYSIRWSSCMRAWIFGSTSAIVSHSSGKWMMVERPRSHSVLR